MQYLNKLSDSRKDKIINYHKEHQQLIESAKASSNNHQIWEGGYIDHILQCLYLVEKLYKDLNKLNPLPFTQDSAMIVIYFHDIEKIFKYCKGENIDKNDYYNNILRKRDIIFSAQELNALKYIHGEGDDYSGERRVMNELAAFCHVIDTISARIWHSHKLALE